MYVDVWSVVARRQREISVVEKLWKMKLVRRRPALVAVVAYYKVSNAVLERILKAKTWLSALL